MHEILVIVTRTNFDPINDDHWKGIWDGYIHGGYSFAEWADYADKEEDFRKITLELHSAGKLHQPRKFGAFPQRMPEYWYDVILTAETHEDNPAIKKAWENYKTLANLI